MAKNLIISILAVLLSGIIADLTAAGGSKKGGPLREGFVLTGVDGKLTPVSNKQALTRSNSNDRWFFEFDSDLNDDEGRIRAGTVSELLPSATLEKMIADANGRRDTSYRLWGKVTKYKGRNFIFPTYFLPLSKVRTPFGTVNRELNEPRATNHESRITINEPNDALTIPQKIITKLATRKIIRTEQLRKGLELKQDSILAGRSALLVERADCRPVFVLDALGRNVPKISFLLLPCRALERAQHRQSVELDTLRFEIAGIVTKYKGQYYLLLNRATRIYSHENFGR